MLALNIHESNNESQEEIAGSDPQLKAMLESNNKMVKKRGNRNDGLEFWADTQESGAANPQSNLMLNDDKIATSLPQDAGDQVLYQPNQTIQQPSSRTAAAQNQPQ